MRDSRARLGEELWRTMVGFHRLLLRLGGRVPDETLAALREMLSSDQFFQLPYVVSGTAAELKLSLSVGEVAFLREAGLYMLHDAEPPGIDLIPISPVVPSAGHRFLPVSGAVWSEFGERIPARFSFVGSESDSLLDLPPEVAGLQDIALRLTDLPDNSAVISLSLEENVLSVWRAWRFPPEGELGEGIRVFLVEVDPECPAWSVTGEIQEELADLEVQDPQVEVFWTGMELPPYHRSALAGAATLWQRDIDNAVAAYAQALRFDIGDR